MIRDSGMPPRGRAQTSRFLWPAAGMMAAMLLLVAGAFADGPSWWHELPSLISRVAGGPGSAVEPVSPESPHPETMPPPDRNVPRQEEQDLRARIAQESKDLAELRAEAEEAR